MSRVTLDGIGYSFIGQNDSAGYLVGGTSVAAAGAEAQLHRVRGKLTMPLELPAPNYQPQFDDDKTFAQKIFPNDQLPNGDLSLNVLDDDLINLVQSTTAEAIGTGSFTPLISAPTDPVRLTMFLNLSATLMPDGTKKWVTFVIPGIEMTARGTSLSRQGTNQAVNYSMAINEFTRKPWGELLSTSTNGTTSSVYLFGINDYPYLGTPAKGDNAETVFDMAFTPYEDSADAVQVFVDGTAKTYTTDFTVDTANKQVTFVAAPATDAKINIQYFYDASELS